MIRTTDKGIERLPLHKAIIDGIKVCVAALDNLKNREPKINPSTDVGSLHQDHRSLWIHKKEVAEVKGKLSAFLNLLTCDIKKEHLEEMIEELWNLTQGYDNREVVLTLGRLRIKKPATRA